MLVLSKSMGDDGLTNLNWLVQHNPIAPLSPSTAAASPYSLPYSSSSSTSSLMSDQGNGYQQGLKRPISPMADYRNEKVKPPYSYAQLITMAMESYGGRKVLLTDIYTWIRDNFAYFRGTDTSWQNSVRHNLSLNKQFVKVPREQKDKGKGSYWMLDCKNLTKDPYCLRRRNFADTGPSAKRVQKQEVSRPQVNPAVKSFLERAQRIQEARRHPFAGAGETLEDIGAQECVYSDTEPFDQDFNQNLFKRDVELYDPAYCPLMATATNSKRSAANGHVKNGKNRPDVDSSVICGTHLSNENKLCEINNDTLQKQHEPNGQPKVRVEYNWEAYEYHPSNVAGAHLPLEPETTRLDLRIPTPEWWTATNLTANLLLSPSNGNPLAKVFENLSNTTTAVTHTTLSVASAIGQNEDRDGGLVTTVNGESNRISDGCIRNAPGEGDFCSLDTRGDPGHVVQNNETHVMTGNFNHHATETLILTQRISKDLHPWIDHDTNTDADNLLLDLDYTTTNNTGLTV